jgi:transcriptional regulator with XRE-family HTH domain
MSAANDISDENELSGEMLKQMGERIKTLRKQSGFTNADFFAYHHNIKRAQYHRYESGQDLRFSSIVKLAAAFGVSISEFFKEGFN